MITYHSLIRIYRWIISFVVGAAVGSALTRYYWRGRK